MRRGRFEEAGRDWSRKLYEAGYAGLTWPQGVRRRRRSVQPPGDLPRGDGARRGAVASRRDRARDGRADDHRPRHRGAEEGAPREDPLHRGDLVPGLLRAGRRLRPRRRAHDRAQPRTATTSSSTARRSGRRSRTSPTGASSSRAATPTAQRHAGLTYLLVDMHAPGVEVRPLRQITGEAEFNEIFFTGREVPVENVRRRGRRRLGRSR